MQAKERASRGTSPADSLPSDFQLSVNANCLSSSLWNPVPASQAGNATWPTAKAGFRHGLCTGHSNPQLTYQGHVLSAADSISNGLCSQLSVPKDCSAAGCCLQATTPCRGGISPLKAWFSCSTSRQLYHSPQLQNLHEKHSNSSPRASPYTPSHPYIPRGCESRPL